MVEVLGQGWVRDTLSLPKAMTDDKKNRIG